MQKNLKNSEIKENKITGFKIKIDSLSFAN